MSRGFFICATPRSGSAWLSNLLTYGGSYCQHEPLCEGAWIPTQHEVSGAVDTGASFIGYEPPEGVRVFHLWREPDEIRLSLARMGLPSYDLSSYKRGFEYKRLFDVSYLEALWDEVVGLPFDRGRAQMLIDLRVTVDFPRLMQRIARSMKCPG